MHINRTTTNDIDPLDAMTNVPRKKTVHFGKTSEPQFDEWAGLMRKCKICEHSKQDRCRRPCDNCKHFKAMSTSDYFEPMTNFNRIMATMTLEQYAEDSIERSPKGLWTSKHVFVGSIDKDDVLKEEIDWLKRRTND
jgi:hypothetical protein